MKAFLSSDKGWQKVYKKNSVKDWSSECARPNRNGTYLAGRLGMDAWLDPAVKTFRMTQKFAPAMGPALPTVNSVSPPKGPSNKPVTVHGSNFTKGQKVLFGGERSPRVDFVDSKTLRATPPPEPDKAKLVVTVPGDPGQGAEFTYCDSCSNLVIADTVSDGGGQTSAKQSPSIGATFTFTIKSTGTFGPSFVLSRTSGGSSNLFNLVRTDNNYVNIVLTPTYYCSTSQDEITGKCIATPVNAPTGVFGRDVFTQQVIPVDPANTANAIAVANAIARAEFASQNLNLAHLISP